MTSHYREYDTIFSTFESSLAAHADHPLAAEVAETAALLTVPNVLPSGRLELPPSKLATDAIMLVLAKDGEKIAFDMPSTQPTPNQVSRAHSQLEENGYDIARIGMRLVKTSDCIMHRGAVAVTTSVGYGLTNKIGSVRARPSIVLNMDYLKKRPDHINPTLVHEQVHAKGRLESPVLLLGKTTMSERDAAFEEEYEAYSAERMFYTKGHYPLRGLTTYIADILDMLRDDVTDTSGAQAGSTSNLYAASQRIGLNIIGPSDGTPPTDAQWLQMNACIQRIHETARLERAPRGRILDFAYGT